MTSTEEVAENFCIFNKISTEEMVATINGDVDAHVAPDLREKALAEVVRDSLILRLVVDLANAPFVDSSGLSVFIALHQELASRGGSIVIRNASQTTQKVLEITGLDQQFIVERS